MTNINKIIITYIDLNDVGYMPSLELFHYHMFFDMDKFIGVTIDNKVRRIELEESGVHKIFNIISLEYSVIPKYVKDKVLEYVGYNLSLDDILDVMNEIDSNDIRNYYLETLLYYKTHQEGKKLNEYKLRVKHFDDLINYFNEDFYSYKIMNNNEDFSESEIILETYLTDDELKEKFKDYLL